VDEGNNWVNIAWGPLTLSNPSIVRAAGTNAAPLGNYGPAANSPVINFVPSSAVTYAAAPTFDFYGNARKTNNAVDAGAVEFGGAAPSAALAVAPTSVTFGNQPTGSTSAAQTLTLTNSGGAGATTIAVAFTGPFSRPTGAAGGTCGATLAAAASCSINIVFSPTAVGAQNGTATITANATVSGSPVQLSGTGIARVATVTFLPATWTPSATRGCTATSTPACPSQTFTLTNTGNVNVTTIAQGVLGGANASEFTINRTASSCGPTGGGQVLGNQMLAPGAFCVVVVRFTPLIAQTTGAKTATVSVTDSVGTQTSTMTGTAN
jgi:hypothetical protein